MNLNALHLLSMSLLAVPISDLLAEKFTLSMEFFPPRTPEHKQSFHRHLEKLSQLGMDFCSITYGAGGTTTELTPRYVVEISGSCSVPAAAHLTCIEHTHESLSHELDIFDHYGISNILALRGDPKTSGEPLDKKNEIFYASELVEVLRARGSYCVGVAAHPEGHSDQNENDLDHQARKIEQADFAITQLFFNSDFYFRFRDEMTARGVTTPIIPGILPLTNMDRLRKIIEMSGAVVPDEIHNRLSKFENASDDQRREGVDIASEMSEKLRSGGAPGLHFYTMNRADSVQAIFERLQK